jgi:hypothetical protein
MLMVNLLSLAIVNGMNVRVGQWWAGIFRCNNAIFLEVFNILFRDDRFGVVDGGIIFPGICEVEELFNESGMIGFLSAIPVLGWLVKGNQVHGNEFRANFQEELTGLPTYGELPTHVIVKRLGIAGDEIVYRNEETMTIDDFEEKYQCKIMDLGGPGSLK